MLAMTTLILVTIQVECVMCNSYLIIVLYIQVVGFEYNISLFFCEFLNMSKFCF